MGPFTARAPYASCTLGSVLGRDPIQEGPLLGAPRRSKAVGVDPASDILLPPGGPTPRPQREPATGRRRRRRWLVAAFATALLALVGLDWSVAVPRGTGTAGPLVTSLRDAVNGLRGPPRIGLQVGHLDAAAMPAELATLRTSTGAQADGLEEVQVNHAIVRALAARLRRDGFRVDVFDATVPIHYRADLFLAVHADANANPGREGYKSAHFLPLRNGRDPLLKLDIDRAVLEESPLGDDDRNVSLDMLKYYAFNARRFRHALARSTPGLIVEMGYLTSARDRAYLERPALAARALADGVVTYLHAVGRIPPGSPGPSARRAP